MANTTIKRLQQDLRAIQSEPVEGVYVELYSDSNFFDWRIFFEGPKNSPFENGVYEAKLTFPTEYPYAPPVLTIVSKFWHPNVYPDGKVCLSVLHAPGSDPLNPGETPEMRWLPIHTVSSIIQCFISILDCPGGAPANVDAQSEYNNNRSSYIERVKALAIESKKTVPSRIRIPHPDTDPNDPTYQKRIRKLKEDFKLTPSNLYDEDYDVDDDGEDYDDYNYDNGLDYIDDAEKEEEQDKD
eukprot:TRINITY_DN1670_c0_g2_i1.p1 TRINITY_DN1670_c0_g2~~TRINITY_DN1670_c0_g2_i1.p1  ORF type:complete len:241 (-),score=37.64 TRINITY_DN1670_c0_g2_i1:140-862(-)